VDYKIVDALGKEIPKSEARKILELLGLGEILEEIHCAHAMDVSSVLGEIAALSRRSDRLLHVSYRFEKETGKWFASVEDIRADFKVELEFEQHQSRDGLPYWEVTFKLPFEWSSAITLVNAAFARLNSEVSSLKAKVDELNELYGEVEKTLERISKLNPRSLRRLNRLVRELWKVSKALEEVEEEAEEEEEEEEEW